MDEGTGERKDEETKAIEVLFAPIDKMIQRRIRHADTVISGLRAQMEVLPDTEAASIQKQIGELGIAIVNRDKLIWRSYRQVYLNMLEMAYDLGKQMRARPTIKQSMQIAAKLISDVKGQSSLAKPPDPPDLRQFT